MPAEAHEDETRLAALRAARSALPEHASVPSSLAIQLDEEIARLTARIARRAVTSTGTAEEREKAERSELAKDVSAIRKDAVAERASRLATAVATAGAVAGAVGAVAGVSVSLVVGAAVAAIAAESVRWLWERLSGPEDQA